MENVVLRNRAYKQTLSKLSIYNLKHINDKSQASVTSNFNIQLPCNIDTSRLEGFGMSELITAANEFLAFGKWLSNAKSNPGIGIMNICNIPIQSKAYIEKYKVGIKTKLEPFRDPKITEDVKRTQKKIHDLLIANTRNKICHYKPSIVVLCGRTAEYFYNEAKNDQGAYIFPNGYFIYHPSRIFDNNNISKIPNHILNLSKALEEYVKK